MIRVRAFFLRLSFDLILDSISYGHLFSLFLGRAFPFYHRSEILRIVTSLLLCTSSCQTHILFVLPPPLTHALVFSLGLPSVRFRYCRHAFLPRVAPKCFRASVHPPILSSSLCRTVTAREPFHQLFFAPHAYLASVSIFRFASQFVCVFSLRIPPRYLAF